LKDDSARGIWGKETVTTGSPEPAVRAGQDQRQGALKGLVGALWYVLEVVLFLPVDLITVRVRDALIPRSVKEHMPSLSCRRYTGFGCRVACGPVMKYRHPGAFRLVVCRHCDDCARQCRHPKLREP
jgi:hypothetical protein